MPRRLFNRSFFYGVVSGVLASILYREYKDSLKPMAIKACEKVLELGQQAVDFAESVKCEVDEIRKPKKRYNDYGGDAPYEQCAATDEQSIS